MDSTTGNPASESTPLVARAERSGVLDGQGALVDTSTATGKFPHSRPPLGRLARWPLLVLLLLVPLLGDCASGVDVNAKPPEIASVSVSAERQTLSVGDTVVFTASAQTAKGHEVTDPQVTWVSSDTAVLSVNDAGVGTVTAPGFATVTATVGGVSGSVDMTGVARKPYIHILEINGDSTRPGHRIQVADSFVITARLSLPDSAARRTVIWVIGDMNEGWVGWRVVAVLLRSAPPSGGTWDTTFVGYNAPAGEYSVVPTLQDSVPLIGDSVPVSVTNSDVTPPDLQFVNPLDSAVVTEDTTTLVFQATDPSGVREYDVDFDWSVWLPGGVGVGPVTRGGGLSPSTRITSLRAQVPMPMPFRTGENPIIISVMDMAWNWTVDTLVVIHPSPTTSSISAPTAGAQPAACTHPIAPGLCLVSMDPDGRSTFTRRTLRFRRPGG